jgi:hypothetical protein
MSNFTHCDLPCLEGQKIHKGFFAKLTARRLKRGVPQTAIERFVQETNSHSKPFAWTANPKRVLAAVKRGKQALESLH